MFFNDDSMLDFRANGLSDAIFGGYRGQVAGEMTFLGRAPGALYAEGLSVSDSEPTAGLPLELLLGARHDPASHTVANDDDAPQVLRGERGKDDGQPAILPVDSGPSDPLDLDIPPIPTIPVVELPVITVTPPTLEGQGPAPVIFGRAYESLSFLILDTPYVLGDDFLPVTLRPPLSELLGEDDDGQAWVLPEVGGAWRLG